MSLPAVTIVMPTYNHRDYVGRAVRSVVDQTFGDWELVVVDDGSTDGTGDVVASFEDDRIAYHRREHRGLAGLADAYNLALSRSGGDLVAICEGDDWWPPDKLAVQVPAFADPVAVVWGIGQLVDEDGDPLGSLAFRRGCEIEDLSSRQALRWMLRRNIVEPTVTAMVRRAALDAAGGFRASPNGMFVDLPTWIEIARIEAGGFRFLGALLGHWRRHPAQVTSAQGAAIHEETALLLDRLAADDRARAMAAPFDVAAYAAYRRARGALFRRDWRDARERFGRLLSGPCRSGSLDRTSAAACLLGYAGGVLHLDAIERVGRAKDAVQRLRARTVEPLRVLS